MADDELPYGGLRPEDFPGEDEDEPDPDADVVTSGRRWTCVRHGHASDSEPCPGGDGFDNGPGMFGDDEL